MERYLGLRIRYLYNKISLREAAKFTEILPAAQHEIYHVLSEQIWVFVEFFRVLHLRDVHIDIVKLKNFLGLEFFVLLWTNNLIKITLTRVLKKKDILLDGKKK